MGGESGEARIAELEAEVARLRADQASRRLLDPGEAALLGALSEVPAFIVLYGPDLKVRYINRLVPPMRLADVVGADLYDFIEPEDKPAVRQAMARLLSTGQPVRTSTRGTGPHGDPAEYEAVYALVDEPDGRGVCVVAVDVTEARRRDRELRDSEAKLRLAVAATGLGLWSWTAATRHTEWDARMREITGREVPVDHETYLSELVHPDDRERLQESFSGLFQAGSWQTIGHRVVRPDGSVRWVMSRGQTLVDGRGEVERIVGGTLDVSRPAFAARTTRPPGRSDRRAGGRDLPPHLRPSHRHGLQRRR